MVLGLVSPHISHIDNEIGPLEAGNKGWRVGSWVSYWYIQGSDEDLSNTKDLWP